MSLIGFFKGAKPGSAAPDMKQLETQSNVRECCEKGITLSMTIDEHAVEPLSMFLMVDPKHEWIIIDKLVPDSGNSFVKQSKHLKLTYNLNHVTYNFSSKFLGFVKLKGKVALKISFPEEINTDHVRKYFRVKPSLGRPVKVIMDMPDIQVGREMRDISEGGFSFAFSENDSFAKYLKQGRHIEQIQFTLPDHGLVKTQGIIRGMFKAQKLMICGVEFFQLSDINMDKIYKYVVERQREELKKEQME